MESESLGSSKKICIETESQGGKLMGFKQFLVCMPCLPRLLALEPVQANLALEPVQANQAKKWLTHKPVSENRRFDF